MRTSKVKVCESKSAEEALLAANQYIESLTDCINDILRDTDNSLAQLRGMMQKDGFAEAPVIRFVASGASGKDGGLERFRDHLINIARKRGETP